MILPAPHGLRDIIETFGDIGNKGFEASNIVMFDLPYPLAYAGRRVFRSQAHKLAVPNFIQALMDIEHSGLASHVYNYGGIYAPRPQRAHPRFPSTHSWGIAIDVEPEKYPLGSTERLPEKVIECFTRAGFTYGGDFKGRKDPMHFQLCSGY